MSQIVVSIILTECMACLYNTASDCICLLLFTAETEPVLAAASQVGEAIHVMDCVGE